jgi:aromatic-L-amino-acid decarboxylase
VTREEFRKYGYRVIDWITDYYGRIEDLPVKSPVSPGDIASRLPEHPPENSEAFEEVMKDFDGIVLPGVTHWQHPSFFAYFNANSSFPSILAEMLTAALGAQCMICQTSPAAAEMEERMMDWLKEMTGLPPEWHGVIQDTASTSTLCSILTAREKAAGWAGNSRGGAALERLTVYCSSETHSSIEKAVRIAGLGSENIRKIDVDDNFALVPSALEAAIDKDKKEGFTPCCVVATIGTTGSTAVDPLRAMADICSRHAIWLHVDAALAGTAMLLPECRWMVEGIELADSYVFNPHKWMFTNFDCSAYFVKDREALIRTFEIHPEYLKTGEKVRVNNYRDWGIQLGRRFRALKLWFVIRSFGVEGLKRKVGAHLEMARGLAEKIGRADDFELLAPVPLNTICFRYTPAGISSEEDLNRINAELLENLNATGRVYMTHTKLRGKYTLRIVIGQTSVEQRHVDSAWDLIQETAQTGVR